MRAVIVRDYGGAPVVAEVPTPRPGPGQVLIKIRAAAMNPGDRTLASGDWQPAPATFPMVLGADCEASSRASARRRGSSLGETNSSASC